VPASACAAVPLAGWGVAGRPAAVVVAQCLRLDREASGPSCWLLWSPAVAGVTSLATWMPSMNGSSASGEARVRRRAVPRRNLQQDAVPAL